MLLIFSRAVACGRSPTSIPARVGRRSDASTVSSAAATRLSGYLSLAHITEVDMAA